MNRVAAAAAASFAVALVACSSERPVSARSGDETSKPVVARSFPSHAAPPGAEPRDAKEAAEDAARRIFGATSQAASRLRDVGVGAIQAVQGLREPDSAADPQQASEEVADAASNSPDPVQSLPVRN